MAYLIWQVFYSVRKWRWLFYFSPSRIGDKTKIDLFQRDNLIHQEGRVLKKKLSVDDPKNDTSKRSLAYPKDYSKYSDNKKRDKQNDSIDFGLGRGSSGAEENFLLRQADILKLLG